MPRLILLRHAEAAASAGQDVERPLTPAGRDAAAGVGRALAELGARPNLVLVSPARRTRETWELVAEALGPATVRVEDRLYAATAEVFLDVIRESEPDVGSLLLVAHNPGIEDLARLIVGAADPTAQAQLMHTFPAGSFAVIDFAEEGWRKVDARSGRLERFVTPRASGR